MKLAEKLLIWDFDGTLGYRIGGWSSSLLETLQHEINECPVTADHFRPHLQAGFPWHTPDKICPAGRSANQWWDNLDSVFERAFASVGIDALRARKLAKEVRYAYPNPIHWRLFDDAIPAIEALSTQGWTHALLSNHTPELPSIVDYLQLNSYFAAIFSSAETGCEKPHPQAFHNVLTFLNNPGLVWMIGDSMVADVAGAEMAGIPAILVRKHHKDAKFHCDNLLELSSILN